MRSGEFLTAFLFVILGAVAVYNVITGNFVLALITASLSILEGFNLKYKIHNRAP
jgi:hypothetical protein